MSLVAVYGTLRQGQGNYHRLLSQYEMITLERTEEEWEMHSLGGFPAIIPGFQNIVIEIFDVDRTTMDALDRLEGYPNFYDRRQITTSLGDAWIYFQHELSWDEDPIPDGDWVKHHNYFTTE